MMLTNAHQTTATAMTYLHVLYIESGKVLELAESYPERALAGSACHSLLCLPVLSWESSRELERIRDKKRQRAGQSVTATAIVSVAVVATDSVAVVATVAKSQSQR
eukprot:5729557-Pleurochrysis_carterae.AAC.1